MPSKTLCGLALLCVGRVPLWAWERQRGVTGQGEETNACAPGEDDSVGGHYVLQGAPASKVMPRRLRREKKRARSGAQDFRDADELKYQSEVLCSLQPVLREKANSTRMGNLRARSQMGKR